VAQKPIGAKQSGPKSLTTRDMPYPSPREPYLQMILLPSGKRLHSYEKSPCLMGKSTISMVIFNSKLLNYQRVDVPIILVRIAHVHLAVPEGS